MNNRKFEILKKLLLHMEEYAKNIGVQRKKAHKFYEDNRYSKDSFCFDKTV